MVEPYTSYEADAMNRGITMLAGSAAFRTLLGAADPTAARGRIIESFGGTPSQAGSGGNAVACNGSAFACVPPFGVVHIPDLTPTLIGVGVLEYRFECTWVIFMPRRVGSEMPPEQLRRARNVLGTIRLEIQSQFGNSNCFGRGVVRSESPELPDESGADRDAIVGTLIASLEG